MSRSGTMFGFADNDLMIGGDGDDTMSGGSGNDILDGNFGDDNINGNSGDDVLIGNFGADILKGSSGNDQISHVIRGSTVSDNAKDTIDCGSGIDEAWINISRDGDTAINCETVHSE